MAVSNVFTGPVINDRGAHVFTALVGRGAIDDLFVAVPLGPGDDALWAVCEVSSRDAADLIATLERSASTGEVATLSEELAHHRWIVPGVALTASAALGAALPGILSFLRELW